MVGVTSSHHEVHCAIPCHPHLYNFCKGQVEQSQAPRESEKLTEGRKVPIEDMANRRSSFAKVPHNFRHETECESRQARERHTELESSLSWKSAYDFGDFRPEPPQAPLEDNGVQSIDLKKQRCEGTRLDCSSSWKSAHDFGDYRPEPPRAPLEDNGIQSTDLPKRQCHGIGLDLSSSWKSAYDFGDFRPEPPHAPLEGSVKESERPCEGIGLDLSSSWKSAYDFGDFRLEPPHAPLEGNVEESADLAQRQCEGIGVDLSSSWKSAFDFGDFRPEPPQAPFEDDVIESTDFAKQQRQGTELDVSSSWKSAYDFGDFRPEPPQAPLESEIMEGIDLTKQQFEGIRLDCSSSWKSAYDFGDFRPEPPQAPLEGNAIEGIDLAKQQSEGTRLDFSSSWKSAYDFGDFRPEPPQAPLEDTVTESIDLVKRPCEGVRLDLSSSCGSMYDMEDSRHEPSQAPLDKFGIDSFDLKEQRCDGFDENQVARMTTTIKFERSTSQHSACDFADFRPEPPEAPPEHKLLQPAESLDIDEPAPTSSHSQECRADLRRAPQENEITASRNDIGGGHRLEMSSSWQSALDFGDFRPEPPKAPLEGEHVENPMNVKQKLMISNSSDELEWPSSLQSASGIGDFQPEPPTVPPKEDINKASTAKEQPPVKESEREKYSHCRDVVDSSKAKPALEEPTCFASLQSAPRIPSQTSYQTNPKGTPCSSQPHSHHRIPDSCASISRPPIGSSVPSKVPRRAVAKVASGLRAVVRTMSKEQRTETAIGHNDKAIRSRPRSSTNKNPGHSPRPPSVGQLQNRSVAPQTRTSSEQRTHPRNVAMDIRPPSRERSSAPMQPRSRETLHSEENFQNQRSPAEEVLMEHSDTASESRPRSRERASIIKQPSSSTRPHSAGHSQTRNCAPQLHSRPESARRPSKTNQGRQVGPTTNPRTCNSARSSSLPPLRSARTSARPVQAPVDHEALRPHLKQHTQCTRARLEACQRSESKDRYACSVFGPIPGWRRL